jgi:hypothetical protein
MVAEGLHGCDGVSPYVAHEGTCAADYEESLAKGVT